MANDNKFGDSWDLSLGGVDVCGDNFNLQMSRQVVNVRTNCGNNVIAGANEYQADLSGPLGFGSGSTEATAYDAITNRTAKPFEFDPDGSGTPSATNPIHSGSLLASQYSIAAPVGGPITFQLNLMGTDANGYPARAVS